MNKKKAEELIKLHEKQICLCDWYGSDIFCGKALGYLEAVQKAKKYLLETLEVYMNSEYFSLDSTNHRIFTRSNDDSIAKAAIKKWEKEI